MSKSKRPPSGGLFDLPLQPEPEKDEAESRRPAPARLTPERPTPERGGPPRRPPSPEPPPGLFDRLSEAPRASGQPIDERPPVELDLAASGDLPTRSATPPATASEAPVPPAALGPGARGAPGPPSRSRLPGPVDRLLAGLIDLAIHAVVGLALLTGVTLMGIRPTPADLLPVGLFLLVFSFLYTVVPLAFWGHTPGMARSGLVARGRTGRNLTYGQTARRWLGALLTVLLAGLPLLLALRGRSLSDLVSGSATFWRDEVPRPD